MSLVCAGILCLKSSHRFGNKFRRHWPWLRWVLALAVLAFLFHQNREGVEKLIERPHIHWGYLGCGMLFCLAALLLTFLRWYLLIWAQDLPFGLHDALRLGFIGYLFNYVAPGAVGGDLIKASMIAREQTERRLVAVATVFLDRVVGLVGLLILGGVMMTFPTPVLESSGFQYVIGVFQIGAVVSLAGMAVVLLPGISRLSLLQRLVALPKVGAVFGEMINSIRLYQSRWRVLVLGVVMSVISHTGLILCIHFCALALYADENIPSLIGHLQILPPAELAGVLVPLPGGIGALEGAVGYFYQLSGANPDHGFLTAIAYRIMTIVIAIVGAVWYLFNRREIDAALHDLAPEETTGEPARDAAQEFAQVKHMARVPNPSSPAGE